MTQWSFIVSKVYTYPGEGTASTLQINQSGFFADFIRMRINTKFTVTDTNKLNGTGKKTDLTIKHNRSRQL